MRRILTLALMLTVSVSLIFAQNSNTSKSPEAGTAYNKGLDLARKGDYKAAVPLFEQAIKADAMFAQAYYMLGLSQRKMNKYTDAINAFKKAIEVDRQFENAYIALGNLQTEMESYESAINSFNAVLAFNDKSAKAYYGVGNVFFKRKEYDQAINKLQLSVNNDPKYDLAWNILGLAQEKANQLSDAAASFQKAIDATTKRTRKGSYYYRLGNVQLKMKKYKTAEASFMDALKLSRSQGIVGGANFGLGEVYKYLGQKNNAIKYYERAAKVRTWKASADYEIDLLRNPNKYVN